LDTAENFGRLGAATTVDDGLAVAFPAEAAGLAVSETRLDVALARFSAAIRSLLALVEDLYWVWSVSRKYCPAKTVV